MTKKVRNLQKARQKKRGKTGGWSLSEIEKRAAQERALYKKLAKNEPAGLASGGDMKTRPKARPQGLGWTQAELEQLAAQERRRHEGLGQKEPDNFASGDLKKSLDGNDAADKDECPAARSGKV